MRFRIPGTKRLVYLRVKTYSLDDLHLGLDSGKPFKGSHYVLLDYDDVYPNEAQGILESFNLKRGIIIESSPGRYQFASFSPVPFETLFEIMKISSMDKKHRGFGIRNGFLTLRVTPKNIDGQPWLMRVKETLINKKGNNFYNFDAENRHIELITKGINRSK